MSAARARPPLGVALSGAESLALVADRDLLRRLDESGVGFAVAAIDRLDGVGPEAAPNGPTLEATIAVATLAARTEHLGWLAAAAVHRDHPYNLARRVASVDHLSEGRGGLLLGLRDVYAPAGEPVGQEVWGGARLTPGVPLAPETMADASAVIAKLWQSWPAESVVFDTAARVYAHGDQIRRLDHRGVFEVGGPLSVPTTPQGSPVLAWRVSTSAEARLARDAAEIVLWPVSAPELAAAVESGAGGARLYAEVAVPSAGEEVEERLLDLFDGGSVDGVVLRPDPAPEALTELIERTLPRLRERGLVGEPPRGSLREILGLGAPEPLLAGAAAAFPAPTPYDDDQANSKWW